MSFGVVNTFVGFVSNACWTHVVFNIRWEIKLLWKEENMLCSSTWSHENDDRHSVAPELQWKDGKDAKHIYIYMWFLNTMQETCFVFWWLPFSNSYPKGRQVNGPQKSHHSQSVHERFLEFSALANHHSDFYMYLYPSPLPFLEQVLSKDEGM